MVIKGHYIGLPVSDLENIRTQLLKGLEALREGKTFSEVDMGGKMGKKQLLTYTEVVHDLREVQHALKYAMPDVYGRAVKRLVPNFNKALQYAQIIINGGDETYLPEDLFVDLGATGFDPKEGTIPVKLLDPPVMTRVGEQKIYYEAYDFRGKRVLAERRILIKPYVVVEGADKLTGGALSDGKYYYKDEISLKTFVRGFYAHEDTLSSIAKDKEGRWNLYGGAGFAFDSMDGIYRTPQRKADQSWENIDVLV